MSVLVRGPARLCRSDGAETYVRVTRVRRLRPSGRAVYVDYYGVELRFAFAGDDRVSARVCHPHVGDAWLYWPRSAE